MKLNVLERLMASSLLPKEGNFTNLKLIRVAREALSFNEDENKILNFRQTGDQLVWDTKANILKNINLGEVATIMLVDALKKLDADGKLTDEHFSLYEKFVENTGSGVM
jgi:hypothetical protein